MIALNAETYALADWSGADGSSGLKSCAVWKQLLVTTD
jgi:hypothetical protein